MTPYLELHTGPDAGKRYPLAKRETLLGRDPQQCDIVVNVGTVSRRHARIVQKSGGYFLEDTDSRAGTFLDDQKVQGQLRLRNGHRVKLCDVEFKFQSDDANETIEQSDRAFRIADDPGSGSTIMSSLPAVEVTGGSTSGSSRSGIQLTASAEAKLEALLKINRSLAMVLALDDVLPQVLDSLFQIFVQADRGFIVLRGPEGQLIPRFMKARREGTAESARISRTIVNKVLDSKEALLSADAAGDSRFDLSQSIADFRIRSMMCAPLMDSEGNALGVLQIDTLDQRKKFEAGDLEILASVAAQAGIAISNAKLYELRLQQKVLEQDLQTATDVQRSFLPDRRPSIAGYDFFDYYKAANEVGGDYYDYIALPDGRMAVVVADVVGHGVAAALLMAKLSAETRYALLSQPDLARALTALNKRFCLPRSDRFITIVIVLINPRDHSVTIVNGGHMAPIWRKADGTLLDAGEDIAGLPIGIMEDFAYEQAAIQLEPGDCLTLYTDGLNEAMDSADVQFSIGRLKEIIREFPGGMPGYGMQLIQEIRKHIGTASQDDDMCLVCVGRAS